MNVVTESGIVMMVMVIILIILTIIAIKRPERSKRKKKYNVSNAPHVEFTSATHMHQVRVDFNNIEIKPTPIDTKYGFKSFVGFHDS